MSLTLPELLLIGGLLFYALLLSSLYLASAKRPIPDNVLDILPPDDHERIRSCQIDSYRFIQRCVIVYSAVIILMIVTDGLKAWFGIFPNNPMIIALAADGAMAVIMAFLLLTYRHVMKIRESYKVGTKTWKSIRKRCYICCALVLLLCFLLFLLSITSSLESFLRSIPPLLPYMLMMVAVIVLYITIMYSLLLLRSEPFPDGELSDRIQEFIRRSGIKHCAVRMISIESNDRMNGCCMHLFHKSFIFLSFNPEEKPDENKIMAVMAHEAGHCIYDRQRASNIHAVILLASVAILKGVFEYLGPAAENESLLLVVTLLYMCVFMPFMSSVALKSKRRTEYRADAFAVEQGYAEDMISLLKNKRDAENTFLNPHPFLVQLTYTHPPISQRIAAIEERKRSMFQLSVQ